MSFGDILSTVAGEGIAIVGIVALVAIVFLFRRKS